MNGLTGENQSPDQRLTNVRRTTMTANAASTVHEIVEQAARSLSSDSSVGDPLDVAGEENVTSRCTAAIHNNPRVFRRNRPYQHSLMSSNALTTVFSVSVKSSFACIENGEHHKRMPTAGLFENLRFELVA